jgi:hypothetical protein
VDVWRLVVGLAITWCVGWGEVILLGFGRILGWESSLACFRSHFLKMLWLVICEGRSMGRIGGCCSGGGISLLGSMS